MVTQHRMSLCASSGAHWNATVSLLLRKRKYRSYSEPHSIRNTFCKLLHDFPSSVKGSFTTHFLIWGICRTSGFSRYFCEFTAVFRHLTGIANIWAFSGLPTSPSKGTKGCPDTPVIILHSLTFYVVPSEQILFNSFSEVSRGYTLRAKNLNSVSEEKDVLQAYPSNSVCSFPFQLFKYGYIMLFNYAELKSQCQYYLKSQWLQLGQSQCQLSHILTKKICSCSLFFLQFN